MWLNNSSVGCIFSKFASREGRTYLNMYIYTMQLGTKLVNMYCINSFLPERVGIFFRFLCTVPSLDWSSATRKKNLRRRDSNSRPSDPWLFRRMCGLHLRNFEKTIFALQLAKLCPFDKRCNTNSRLIEPTLTHFEVGFTFWNGAIFTSLWNKKHFHRKM
jgi:hypothetical protein